MKRGPGTALGTFSVRLASSVMALLWNPVQSTLESAGDAKVSSDFEAAETVENYE